MAFKMKGFSGFKLEDDEKKEVKSRDDEKKKFKSRSSDVLATEGEYKGQMVDPRTGMPKGVSKKEPEVSDANQQQIDDIRSQMRGLNPFIDKEKYDALDIKLKTLMGI